MSKRWRSDEWEISKMSKGWPDPCEMKRWGKLCIYCTDCFCSFQIKTECHFEHLNEVFPSASDSSIHYSSAWVFCLAILSRHLKRDHPQPPSQERPSSTAISRETTILVGKIVTNVLGVLIHLLVISRSSLFIFHSSFTLVISHRHSR